MRHWLWITGLPLAFLIGAWFLVSAGESAVPLISQQSSISFLNAGSFWKSLLLSLAVGGCVAAIVSLFRDEARLVSVRLGMGLLSLRLGLVLILFLTLLQPVISTANTDKRHERLLVAVDVSESMDTVDTQASQLELLRGADALGLFKNATVQQRARKWIRSLESGQTPEWIDPQEADSAEKQAQLEKIRQENLSSQLKEVARLPRLEILRQALTSPTDNLLAELTELCELQLTGLADTVIPLQSEQLAQPLTTNILRLPRDHSRIAQLAETVQLHSSPTQLAGILLLSDGHDTTSASPESVVKRLQNLGVPIHTVLVGSEVRPRDLSIMHVDHPESVFITDRPQIKVIVQTAGFEGETLSVSLQSLDTTDQAPLHRTLIPTGAASEVEFTLPELPVGKHRYRVWTDVVPNETREDNNSSDFALQIVDDRARVLVIEGDSRWEFRFLIDALSRDPQVSLDVVLFEQPYLGVLSNPYFPKQLRPEATIANQTPFSTYDVVLIGDVSPDDLQSRHWQDLDRYVRQEGGTLILTAGKKFFPLAYKGTLAENLLPITEPGEVAVGAKAQTGPPEERGFRLSINEDGLLLPMFQFAAEREQSQKIWATLPGHFWGISGKARGGASIWAEPQRGSNVPATEARQALMAQHYVGAGQVIWIGIDSTWRWRYLVGDLYHHRFWGQLMRWAVAIRTTAGDGSIRLGVRESVLRSGQPAQLQVRLSEAFLAQAPDLQLQAVVSRQGEGVPFSQTVPLVSRDGNSTMREAQVEGLPPGEYLAQLKMSGNNTAQTLPEVMFVVNAELSRERQDVHANSALLKEISSASGGQFLYLNELHRLPELLQGGTSIEQRGTEIPLYSHWSILVLFCGLAMTEWVLRKINGLP